MSHSLNLKVNKLPDGQIIVSWRDIFYPIMSPKLKTIYGLIFGGSLLFGFASLWLFGSNSLAPWIIIMMSGVGGYAVFPRIHSKTNQVVFTPEFTTHRGRAYPTAQITRFEYGSRSRLLGVSPITDEVSGLNNFDPSIVRFWVNDTDAVTVSLNAWQIPESHKIRDTLAKALDAIHDANKQDEQEPKSAKSGDFGMPEY